MRVSLNCRHQSVLALVALTLGLSGIAQAVLTPESLRASAITSVLAERPGDQIEGGKARLSGLLVAEAATGHIYYFPSNDPRYAESYGEIELEQLEVLYYFDEPTAIAHFDGGLYVWDARTQDLTLTDLWSGERQLLWHGEPLVAPSQIAVSPEGVIALVDSEAGGIYWFAPVVGAEDGGEVWAQPTLEEEVHFLSPVDLAFISWDTLAVLDSDQESLVTISFTYYRGQLKIAGVRELPVREWERKRLGDLRAVAAQEGVLYVADERSVYIYLETEERLIPALPDFEAHGDVLQLAVSYHDLFVIDGGHIDRQQRTVPVELVLEGGPGLNQTVLLDFYDYLWRRQLLNLQRVSVVEAHQTLERVLLAKKVLIVPSSVYLDDDVKKGFSITRILNRKSMPPEPTIAEVTLDRFGELFCDLNDSWCNRFPDEPFRRRLLRSLDQRLHFEIPSLSVESKLRRTEVVLGDHSVDWHLDRLVFSEEQRSKVDRALLKKLNRDLNSAIEQGIVFLPAETWLVTAAVPAIEQDDRWSELWKIPRPQQGADFHALSRFTKQQAFSPQPPEPNSESARCAVLKNAHRQWLEEIHYPFGSTEGNTGKLIFPELEEAQVRIGVVENFSQLDKTHQVFASDREHPAWHDPVDFDLAPRPKPESFPTNGDQRVVDTSTFESTLHHGTHVAALIGGRKGECWSGLLPSAKLVLIDLTSPGATRDSVLDAYASGTFAFNVSQSLHGDPDKLKELIIGTMPNALFVAAAGNDGKNLDEVASIPFPAAFGEEGNVVTVTASNWEQAIIGPYVTADGRQQEGVNYGKRFVDLVAPGRNVISASGKDRYGPASGSSQAAPQVTAAAAYLLDMFEGAEQTPEDVKARLIATANWHSGLEGKVWGGLFNFGDAVRYPPLNLLHTSTGEGELYSIEPRGNPWIQILHKPVYYERRGDGAVSRERIRFQWILSLRRRSAVSHRVVFLDPVSRRVKILLDAELEGTVRCKSYELLDETTLEFEPRDCGNGISVAQIEEYVRGMPYHVSWD